MIFIDTNYFLRFLLKDNISQHKKAKEIFIKAAEGKVKAFTSLIVFFEIYWVLTSFYEKNKKEIYGVLVKILDMVFVDIEERDILAKALNIFKDKNLDLEDSFNLAYAKAKGASEFLTFDEKLRRNF